MTDKAELALQLVRQALCRYIDVPPEQIERETVLKSVGVDSLTLAELLFELEDRLGKSMPDPAAPPQKVQDIIDILMPHLDGQTLQDAA